jgi:hypothetical protein
LTIFKDQIFTGGKTNVKKSRTLLRNVFSSLAKHLMLPKFTQLHLTLARDQTGIPETVISGQYYDRRPPVFNLDSWQPVQVAAEFGLRAERIQRQTGLHLNALLTFNFIFY